MCGWICRFLSSAGEHSQEERGKKRDNACPGLQKALFYSFLIKIELTDRDAFATEHDLTGRLSGDGPYSPEDETDARPSSFLPRRPKAELQ
jgi:hypothetical protein